MVGGSFTRVGQQRLLNNFSMSGGLAQSMRPSGVRRIYAREGTLDHHSVICGSSKIPVASAQYAYTRVLANDGEAASETVWDAA